MLQCGTRNRSAGTENLISQTINFVTLPLPKDLLLALFIVTPEIRNIGVNEIGVGRIYISPTPRWLTNLSETTPIYPPVTSQKLYC